MKAVTIRGVEPEMAEKLKATAASEGKSVNQLILEIIKKDLGLQKVKTFTRTYDDLDDLFGRWDETDFKKISGKIVDERRTDQELWT